MCVGPRDTKPDWNRQSYDRGVCCLLKFTFDSASRVSSGGRLEDGPPDRTTYTTRRASLGSSPTVSSAYSRCSRNIEQTNEWRVLGEMNPFRIHLI